MAEFGSKTPQTGFGQDPPTGIKECYAKFTLKIVLQAPQWTGPPVKNGTQYAWKGSVNADPNYCGSMKMTCVCIDPPPDPPIGQSKVSVNPIGGGSAEWQVEWHKLSHSDCPANPCEGGWSVKFPDNCPPNTLTMDFPFLTPTRRPPGSTLTKETTQTIGRGIRELGIDMIRNNGLSEICYEIPDPI